MPTPAQQPPDQSTFSVRVQSPEIYAGLSEKLTNFSLAQAQFDNQSEDPRLSAEMKELEIVSGIPQTREFIRAVKHSKPHHLDHGFHVIRGIAALILQESTSSDEDSAIGTELTKELSSPGTVMRSALNAIIEAAVVREMLPQVRLHREHGSTIGADMRDILDDPDRLEDQFILLQMLSAGPAVEDFHIHDLAQWSAVIADFYAATGEAPIFNTLGSKLNEGEYDQPIAKQLIIGALGHHQIEGVSAGNSAELRKLVTLVQLAGGNTEAESIDILAGEKGRGLWHDQLQTMLGIRRTWYADGLTNRESHAVKEAHGNNALIGEPMPREMLKLEVGKLMRGTSIQTRGIIDTSRTNAMRGFGKNKRPHKAEPEFILPKPESEEEKAPRKIVVVNPHTGAISDSQEEITKFKNNLTAPYSHNPKYVEDIDTILEWLSRIDFSSGIVSGIKKYSSRFKLNGEDYAIFALKPSEAVGLRKSWERTRHFRALFTIIDDNTIGLLTIGDRRDIQRYERTNRLNSSS